MVAEVYKESGMPFPEMQMKPELAEYRGMASMTDLMHEIRLKHPQFGTWHDQMEVAPDPKIKMKMTMAYLRLWAKDELGIPLPDWFQSWKAFNGVVQKGFGEILTANKEKQTTAVFSSGGTISCILGKVLNLHDPDKVMGLNTVMQNSALSQMLHSNDRLSLFSFNDLRHLSDELVTAM
jgi:broad specificity phosphatase PhoE